MKGERFVQPTSRIRPILFLSGFLLILFFGDALFNSVKRKSHDFSLLSSVDGATCPLLRNRTVCACGKNETKVLGLRQEIHKDKMGVQLFAVCCANEKEMQHIWLALQSLNSHFELRVKDCQLEDDQILTNFSRVIAAGILGIIRPRLSALRIIPAFASRTTDTTLRFSKHDICFSNLPQFDLFPSSQTKRRRLGAKLLDRPLDSAKRTSMTAISSSSATGPVAASSSKSNPTEHKRSSSTFLSSITSSATIPFCTLT
mmetsp:Transcript_20319/g.26330  ORF Transcript_20319/g.26330 Transcript_20319/m.26330 type:complete len:258 (-) Transcript_20319:1882-2655(-)